MSNFQILFQAVSSSMVKIPFPLFFKGEFFKQPSSLLMYFLVAILSLYGMNAHADYASRIQNSNSGYSIRIDSNSVIEPVARVGSDGKNYYRVGNPIVIDGNSAQVSVSGLVDCVGRRWGSSNTRIHSSQAFHRLFMYVASAGVTIDGKTAYRINNNLVMTVETPIMNWINIDAGMCSYAYVGLVRAAQEFTSQFPVTITFFINEQIIDGKLVIPAMDLAGYVRAFTEPKAVPPFDSWPLSDSTVPMRLAASQLNVKAMCSTQTSSGQASTVNLRHGQLSSIHYDSLVMESIRYTCKFAALTKVRLRLDYVTDGDPQKRLPMKDASNRTIYSKLDIVDEQTGATGTDIRVGIHSNRTIYIRSRIQGNNADAGSYQGSAWLIATFD
ncbi:MULTISPECIES: adhesin [Providencia]|uniref:adhesin n=1 Tax=Providencia TaxID=586 RepID=UPI0021D4BF01|nr:MULTISPECIES: adhesin [Providencia]WIE08720.1 adhesin [Providencia rettgeri]